MSYAAIRNAQGK